MYAADVNDLLELERRQPRWYFKTYFYPSSFTFALAFRDSRFRRNRNSFGELLNFALFAVHDCSGVRVERCVFGPEQGGHLVDTLGSVLFEDCEFSENTWLRGKYAPVPDSRGEDEVH